MQVLGNLDLLKKEISKSYSEKLAEFSKEKEEEFNKEKAEILEQHNIQLKKLKTSLFNEEKKVFKTTLAEEKLNAKKEFENKREKLINKVFETSAEKSKDILLRDDYINFIKEFIREKKEIELIGNFQEYERHFDIKLDNNLNGIIVKQGDEIFDFTYDRFIESRKLDLRHKISILLFKNISKD